MLYIQENLDKELNLDIIASQANLSSFHFHRIFKALQGETPIDFIQRLRIQRASQQLWHNRELPIGMIASNCGFSSLSLFNQVFKRYYNTTPTEYRRKKKGFITQNGIYYDKNGVSIDKRAKNRNLPENIDVSELVFLNSDISIKNITDIPVIYRMHTGHFHKIKDSYEQLNIWFEENYPELSKKDLRYITLYFDDPAITPINRLRQGACICVKDVLILENINKMVICGGKYVVGYFQISTNEYEKAWNTISLWIVENNCKLRDGYDFELYRQGFIKTAINNVCFEIYIPIE